MFERFTPRARRVIVLAEQEAGTMGDAFIGTEHLLLGLLAVDDGQAAQVLGRAEVHTEEARAALLAQRPSGDPPPGSIDPAEALAAIGIDVGRIRRNAEAQFGPGAFRFPRVPFSPQAKHALELSLREALQLHHNYIGTEHLLLGVMAEADDAGAHVLTILGVDLDVLRAQVVAQVAPSLSRVRTAGTVMTELARSLAAAGGHDEPAVRTTLDHMQQAAAEAYDRAAARSREVQAELADELERVLATTKDALADAGVDDRFRPEPGHPGG